MIHVIGWLAALGVIDRESAWVQALESPLPRAVLAALFALLVSLLVGSWLIRLLRKRRVLEVIGRGDSARLDELTSGKKDTPTMGGVIILAGLLAGTLAAARLDERLVILLLVVTFLFGATGFLDDLTKLRSKRRGISARVKLVCLVASGAGAAAYLQFEPLVVTHAAFAGGADGARSLFLPLSPGIAVPLGAAFGLWVVFILTGTSNAINLTDGLDGLATGCVVLMAVVLGVLSLVAGDAGASSGLAVPHVLGAGEVGVFTSALAGASLGFLWFNCHPAQIFMGDTGSLALGGALGLAAVLCKGELFLLLAAAVPVAETVSVLLQVGSYKLRRKRVFLCAPLHHHYQFRGWSETKVTIRLWIVAFVFAAGTLAALGLRR